MDNRPEVYLCDPEKNTACPKTSCFMNGGTCYLTSRRECQARLKVMLDENAFPPTRAHPDDAGLDIYSTVDRWVYADSIETIDTGVHVAIPRGFVGMLTSKSGLMARGITTRGTIDSGYTGSIRAVIYNDGDESYEIRKGQKITQLVIVPCITPEIEIVDSLEMTERGENGFGSTGK